MYSTTECPMQGSDVAHGNFVAAIAQFLRPNFYVEIGCFQGSTFEKVEPYCGKAVAVDIKQESYDHLALRGYGENFVCMSSLEYIATLQDESVDLCFIDSSHEEEMTVKEFHAITPKLVRNGMLLFHDSYPPNHDFERPDRCGGVARAIERIRREPGNFEFCTFPSQYGITVARKSFGRQVLWR